MFAQIITLTVAYLSMSFFINSASNTTQLQKPIPDEEYAVFHSPQASPQILTPTFTPTPTPTESPTPFSTSTPIPTQTSTPTPILITSSDLESFFSKYSDEYHVDRELLKRIANCEAGFNTNAQNGDYAGMFQFATESWITTRSSMGLDTNPDLRKNAEEAIRTAAFKIGNGGQSAWPSC